MIMYKLFIEIDDKQPAYFLQVNPQNRKVEVDETAVVHAAFVLDCHRIDKITEKQDFLHWWEIG